MYYARKTQSSTRFIGIGIAVLVNVVILWVLLSGVGNVIVKKLTETEVVIIEKPKIEDKEPPPPPPVDVDLPPPPPQVILPDFTFDSPPPPTAITQVAAVAKPAPPPAARPAPPPAPVYVISPKPDQARFQEMLTDNYPPTLLRRKVEGEVGVSMCVSAAGQISNVQVIKSSGEPAFDDATVKNLPRVRMTPGKDSTGKAVVICNPPYNLIISWKLPK